MVIVATVRISEAAQVIQSYSPGGVNLHPPSKTRLLAISTRVFPPQTASLSVRPFLQGMAVCPIHTDRRINRQTTKCAASVAKGCIYAMRGMCPNDIKAVMDHRLRPRCCHQGSSQPWLTRANVTSSIKVETHNVLSK